MLYNKCTAGDPVEVLITMFVSSVSSISEVNMVTRHIFLFCQFQLDCLAVSPSLFFFVCLRRLIVEEKLG